MEAIDKQLSPSHAVLRESASMLIGRVVEVDASAVYVSCGKRVHEAARAFSCLVAPEPGDEVSLLRVGDGCLFVTAVLVRTREAPLTLDAPRGLVVTSACDIRLEAAQSVHLQGRGLMAQFDEAHWVVRLLRATGAEFVLRSKAVRAFAHIAEVVCSRLQVAADRSYRHVAEAEHVRAGMLDVRAEHLANVRAGTLILTARELAKVDGTQVHVG